MNAITRRTRRGALVLASAAMLPLALTACSNDDGKDKAASDTKSSAASDKADDSGSGDMNKADEPFGPACASVPKDGGQAPSTAWPRTRSRPPRPTTPPCPPS